jgi:hypothetical protein
LWGDFGGGVGGPFAAGCDLSFGSGASYSALEILDLTNGTQVAELATNEQVPVVFAQTVFDTLNWLNGNKGDEHSFLTFESNGDQGKAFCQELIRLGYGNIQTKAYVSRRKGQGETYYGYRNTDGGLATLSELERAILAGECTIRSEHVREELHKFGKDERGRPSYPKGEIGNGDRAQAFALAWQLAKTRLLEAPKRQTERARSEIERETSGPRRKWKDSWTLRKPGRYGL